MIILTIIIVKTTITILPIILILRFTRMAELKQTQDDAQPEYLRAVNVMSKAQADLKKQELKKLK